MKISRIISLFLVPLAVSVFLASCQSFDTEDVQSAVTKQMDEVNRHASLDDDIEFVFLTPNFGVMNVGWKQFVETCESDPNYPEIKGTSFFFLSTDGKMCDDCISLSMHFQNIRKLAPGDKLRPVYTSFSAFFSSYSENHTKNVDGSIIVKEVTDKTVTLRFVKLRAKIAYGDYYINGDLEFDIE